ncbi:MAG: tetratricopeptide repeat protein [Bacteroidetes bacterium]|nr:tetratricopeptide repeat protein [Bacteroidota bacterium]MBP6411999.1 tetratricopeptide repeat protein [Bacteroidia bacterium]
MKKIALVFFLLFPYCLLADDTELIKQLRKKASTTKDSVELIKVLSSLGWELGFEDLKEGLQITEEALRLALKYKDKPMEAKIYDAIGTFYHDMGDAEKAVEFHKKGIQLYLQLPKSEIGLGNAYLNIARVFVSTGDYVTALEYDLAALKLYKAVSYNSGMPKLYNNIGLVYMLNENYDSSIYYNNKSLWLNLANKDSVNIGRLYTQLGYLYHKKGLKKQADELVQKGVAILERNKNTFQLISAYASLGDLERERGNVDAAIDAYRKSLQYSLELKQLPDIKENYFELYKLYEKKDDIDQAYYYYKLFVRYKDDVMSEQNLNTIRLTEAKFENKNKQKEIEKLKLETRNRELETEKQRWIRNAFIIMLLLAVASVVVLNKQNQERQKINAVLETKNKKISEQNKDITDSIHYAQRIQRAILPSDEYVRELFPSSFIFFQPRDVVSGDFYWTSKHKNTSIIAVVDCTGHGVPGAFMSMIGNSLLNQIVNEQGITKPAEILFKLREEVIKALKQTGAIGESRDGMDIAICCIENKKLQFAGANNPLIFIRNNQLTEYKGDKQPIGIYSGTPKPFTNHEIDLQTGDCIYLYSDGYADQFGGHQNKKFKYAQLKELLTTIVQLPMERQREKLQLNFEAWKSDNEQVDDVLVIGIRT